MTADTPKEHWKREPDDHDYPAAADYLSLLFAQADVDRLVTALKSASVETHKAKDLLRASELAVLSTENPHVAKDLAKIRSGARLSPVLVVRGDAARRCPLIVADGHHRICASYHVDEDADIPCRTADLPDARW